MPRVPSRDEIPGILTALLLTRKEALTTGISLAQLDNDYRNQVGTHIPFREFGYGCLLDFLQTLTERLIIRYRHGMHHAFPVVDDKTQHVSDLVAAQNDNRKRITRVGRRQTRSPSPWYPRVIEPPVRMDYRTLAEVVEIVKQLPGGISFDYIHNYACEKMNYNIDKIDLVRQLSEISHEIIMDHNVLYPVTQHPRISDSRNESAATATTGATVETKKQVVMYRPGGDADSSEDSDKDFVSISRHTARNDGSKIRETNDSCRENSRTSKEIHEKSAKKNYHTDETMKNIGNIEESSELERNENFATVETIADLITPKTRIRLEMLIRKYPDGVWCAELPNLYKKEYTIPLNYEEIGFGSVSDFASHLPGIFHCIQPQERGDFKLFDAKAGKPNVKQTRRTVLTTAVLHNIYKYESDAIPSVLSKETAARLIPDGVMTADETVAQICVTELDRGIHEYIDVVVVDVFTPSFFWIHLRRNIQIFRRFMDDLHEFYERNSSKYVLPIAVMERGLNCACLFDRRWHRAIIKAVQPDNSITVLFYDYGTVGTYSPERIYFLHRSFSNLPAQAIPCGLYNVKPVGTQKWSRSITVEFLQKVSNIPLVATIAHIDTNNNSMMVGLTNTDGVEDFHINDWMVQAGYATYGKMVETVDMNDQSVEIIHNKGVTRQPPSLSLSTIPEEIEYPMKNSTLANGIVTSEGIVAMFNHQLMMMSKLARVEISKCVNYGITYDSCEPTARNELDLLFQSLLDIGLNGQRFVETLKNYQTPPIPPLPKSMSQSNKNLAAQTTAEYKNGNVYPENLASESCCPNFDGPPSMTSKHDVNMNISEKPSTIDQLTLATNDISHVKTTIDPEIIQSYYDDISSESLHEDPTRLVETSREISENSLFQAFRGNSAENFFERLNSSSRQETSVDFSNEKLRETNPFKKDVDEMNDFSSTVPALPPRNSPRRPYGCVPNSPNNNLPVQSETRVIYEIAPIIYDNAIKNDLRNTLDGGVSTILMEHDDLSEIKRVNVESWIENGHRTSENYTQSRDFSRYGNSAPPLPPRNLPSSVSNCVSRENLCNGTKLFGDNFSEVTGPLTSSEWLRKVENTMSFRREHSLLQNFDDSQLRSNGAIVDGKEAGRTMSRGDDAINRDNSSKLDHTMEQKITSTKRDNLNEFVDFRAVRLSNGLVYLINYNNEGWIVVEEFSALIGKTPEETRRILAMQNVDMPYRVVGRTDNPRLFDKLDRTSLRVQRNHNKKIVDSLNLVPLKLTLKVLLTQKLVSRDQIVRAVEEGVFPTDSSLLFDIYKLINAFGEIHQ